MKIQNGISENTYDLLKLGLKASNLRAKTIANNMSNINTKNYKRFSVVFEENLKNEADSGFKMRTTNDNKHLSDDENIYGDNIQMHQDNSTSMRTDGNNVDLEVEKVNQAANTLKYYALVTGVNNKFNNLKTVIK